jgi:lipoprotein-anchoring transpeptidase ErfK/SrfK
LPALGAALTVLVAVGAGPATAAPAGLAAVIVHAAGTRALVVPAKQELAILLKAHVARIAPNGHSRVLELVAARRPITEERTTLPVVGHKAGPGGSGWLQVLLPGRPNGHTGWIRSRSTKPTLTRWHIVVDTAKRRVTVYRNSHIRRGFKAVVGKSSTPTPRGRFFVEESIELRSGDVGAPFALALSARSNVFQEFEGGPGQIALHGLANVGGTPGTAVSHGCVRLDSEAMHWLVVHTGPGVPVTITG